MSSVFIVRPFGNKRPVIKKEKDGSFTTVYFDFDRVEKELIKPAMKKLGLSGGTTGKIFNAGDIREDMFSELLIADIVIADITIYNPNVFYELGIRHALRNKFTILIKSPGLDQTPFDIMGYRYLLYDRVNPAAKIDELVRSISETLQENRTDSPVFNVLPHLLPQEPESYIALPQDYVDEVRVAADSKFVGKLSLLAHEVEKFQWRISAWKLVGEELFRLKKYHSAKEIMRKVISSRKNKKDLYAHDRLSTIYQRLAEKKFDSDPNEAKSLLTQSDISAEIIIKDKQVNSRQRAEAYTLIARNHKSRWIFEWKNLNNDVLQKKALQSPHLMNAYENYRKGFMQNLNHYYSGYNAVELLYIITGLAEKHPDAWEDLYDEKEEAERKLIRFKKEKEKLLAAFQFSIDSARAQTKSIGKKDVWLDLAEADLIHLTAKSQGRVSTKYNSVFSDADELTKESVMKQLNIFKSLEILPENTAAALDSIHELTRKEEKTEYYLLFTGHMIDKKEREVPRFPPEKEKAVTQSIRAKIIEIQNELGPNKKLIGITGGACGGDIIFHEQCKDLGVTSRMFLAVPAPLFKIKSVAFAGNDWIKRFDALYEELDHPVLSDTLELPHWLRNKRDYKIWQRNNLWELYFSLANGISNMTLLAVWDKQKSDGPGGTEDMVKQVKDRGGKVEIIDIRKI
ncbi:tetratricopeptide repeat-containing protein [Moheibacter lacus]|uniref:DUF4071 domain-containing protein n=1 Tax=Moheibacter lacus TaxID=2745851 RepID=A0A838ZT89_9FLAO|nr:tetratricopeptide repeat-containing protein [Moheibacter lacus]MBA5630196.1 hypothetical protein [Moheibacter lacus]